MTQTSAALSASCEQVEPRRGIVVVAVDGSPDSDRAVRFAVGEAQRRGHGLRLVHVESQSSMWAPIPSAWPTVTFRVPKSWDPDVRYGLVVTGVDVCRCDEGRDVVSAAFAEAAARGSRLELTHAWRPDGVYDVAIGARVLEAPWADAARRELTHMVLGTRASETVPWSVSARYERPALALHEASEHADLLVVGRHGHDSRAHRSLGSTARAVLRSSRCPVMVVPRAPHVTPVGRQAPESHGTR